MPGELRGLEYIHKRYGSLLWGDILRPAIGLARDGFVVSEDFAKAMDLTEKYTGHKFLSEDAAWAIDFAPNGSRVGKGEFMTRKRYAKTLETVARHGVDAFYSGPIADALIETIQNHNGSLVKEDMEGYEIVSRKPVEIEYKRYRVLACGAPASGTVTLSALKILEGYDVKEKGLGHLEIHRMTEAMRFGYGKVRKGAKRRRILNG